MNTIRIHKWHRTVASPIWHWWQQSHTGTWISSLFDLRGFEFTDWDGIGYYRGNYLHSLWLLIRTFSLDDKGPERLAKINTLLVYSSQEDLMAKELAVNNQVYLTQQKSPAEFVKWRPREVVKEKYEPRLVDRSKELLSINFEHWPSYTELKIYIH